MMAVTERVAGSTGRTGSVLGAMGVGSDAVNTAGKDRGTAGGAFSKATQRGAAGHERKLASRPAGKGKLRGMKAGKTYSYFGVTGPQDSEDMTSVNLRRRPSAHSLDSCA